MIEFLFDQQKSPEENIDAFFAYLETIDRELAELLRVNIKDMPLSDAPETERNQMRRSINNKIAAFLDKSA
jgi:hypothetical protein